MLRVCFVVGDNKTKHCGVKDYAKTLASALEPLDVHVEVVAPEHWGCRNFLSFASSLRRRKFDVVHLQYPSIGFRASLMPHLLGIAKLARTALVTVHEFSALPLAQRMSMQLFRLTTDRILFVSEFEQSKYGKTFNGLGAPQALSSIGSNVPAHPETPARKPVVIYFGQLRPRKGLEEFLTLAHLDSTLIKQLRFLVVGSVPERQSSYYHAVRSAASPSVEWLLDLPFEDVAELLSSSLAAYLPFPDGASFRRGSLLASLANGLPVISKSGPATGSLAQELLLAATPEKAAKHLERLLENPDLAASLSEKARAFSLRFSWNEIASRHKQLYEQLLSE